MYLSEFTYALKQLKRIKAFCEEYRSRSPIMLRKYKSVKSLKQLRVSSGIRGSPAKEVAVERFKRSGETAMKKEEEFEERRPTSSTLEGS